MNKFELIEIKYINMYCFDMWEGKFKDTEQKAGDVYIYANLSTFDSNTYAESDVRIYAHSYDTIYCPEDYEITVGKAQEKYLKETILANIPDKNVLCGFIYCHGYKDFSAWEVDLPKEAINEINSILKKYSSYGSSERNVYNCRFCDVLHTEY